MGDESCVSSLFPHGKHRKHSMHCAILFKKHYKILN